MKLLFITILTSLLVLSGCDNLVDQSDQGNVTIKLSEGSTGRYIAGGGDTVDQIALGFVKKDVLYNGDFLEDLDGVESEYVYTGIPVGDYTFLAMLIANDDVISMAVENVSIEAGFNEIPVEMGPGMSLTINDKDFEIDDLSAEFSIAFNGDVITIGVPSEELISNFKLEIKTNAKALNVFNFDGTSPVGITKTYTEPSDEISFSTGIVSFDATSIRDLQFRLTSFDDDETVTTYKIKIIGL
jgi:hypothetical protein